MVIFAVMHYSLNLHTDLFPASPRFGIGMCSSLKSISGIVPLIRFCYIFQFFLFEIIVPVMRRQYRSIKGN